MFITENSQKWTNIIKEELGVTNPQKLDWMSKYACIHEIKEGLQTGSIDGGIYSTPLNTMGMGNPMMPMGVGFNNTDGSGIGNTGADFHNVNYKVGSGDVPMSTLTIALEIAAQTIGLELVPVIPSTGPWAMLSYMDFPYAGGKLGRINETSLDGKGMGAENKPIYVMVNYDFVYDTGKTKNDIAKLADIYFVGQTADGNSKYPTFYGKFIGFSRINGDVIMKVESTGLSTSAAGAGYAADATLSIADVFNSGNVKAVSSDPAFGTQNAKACRADLVATAADHVQGFVNFFDGSDDPMTRAQNETGVGNTIGARMFTKLVQMGGFEVTGSVTRQQLQDMPLYGIDVVGKVLEAMQNEISQGINNRILDRLFRLGVTNAANQKKIQGVDLNLYLSNTINSTKALSSFSAASKYIGIDDINAATGIDTNPKSPTYGTQVATPWGNINNATNNTAAENITTHQRRIMSRLLAAANLIANVSRFGRGVLAVTNTQILSALQDASAFVVAPMTNTLVQDGSKSLYFAGSICGLNIYVDPYMTWDDTRIMVGRKSDGNTPGVIFMPYIIADTVSITAEGTMAPKLLCNSRFAIVDCGFHPEQSFLTFMVDTDGIGLI
jgi:hypothetical protein